MDYIEQLARLLWVDLDELTRLERNQFQRHAIELEKIAAAYRSRSPRRTPIAEVRLEKDTKP